MIKNLDKIEAAFGLKPGEFKTMYEDKEEKEIPIDDVEILKKTDLNTRIENVKKETQNAQVEVTAKELKKRFGVEVEGKDLFKVVDAITTSVKEKAIAEAGAEPNEKVKNLTKDLDVMKTNYDRVTKEKTELEGTYRQRENQRKISSSVISALPKDFIIASEEVAELSLRKASADGITVDVSETGDVVFKKGDLVLKDNNLVPLKADVVLKDYYASYAKPASGGTGGKDNPVAAKAGSYEAFKKEMEDAGKPEGSSDFSKEMKLRISNKTLQV